MSLISSIVPLPGVGELESIAKTLISLLKDDDCFTNKGAALMELLESITEWAGRMDNLAGFTAELREIQKQLMAASKSKSRQRRIVIWNDLRAKLLEKTACTTLHLVAQMREDQIKQNAGLPYQHEIVKRYKIENEVEVRSYIWPGPEYQECYPGVKPVKVALRSGRFKKTAVLYLTFAADSEDTAHKRVEEQIEIIRQVNHVNVAKFVGVTQGCSGLDGIVVAMDGIDIEDFLKRTHSGAVWAECIRGFEAFAGSEPKYWRAERITVSYDGRVVIFPGRPLGMSTKFGMCQYSSKHLDPSVKLIMRIYGVHYSVGLPGFLAFVDLIAKLGLGFTELQVMKAAADGRLFPSSRSRLFGSEYSPLPEFLPNVGQFDLVSSHDAMPLGRSVGLRHWEPLGRSRHVQDVDIQTFPPRSSLEWCKTMAPDGIEWNTCVFRDLNSGLHSHEWRGALCYCVKQLNRPFGFDWENIFTEAQEITRRLNIRLDDVFFCWKILCEFSLFRPESASWNEIPTTLYYHWNPCSSNPYEIMGFCSAEKTPDGGAWQERLRDQGWKFDFELEVECYRMSDDWGCQYERELQRTMEATPGGYPSTQIVEVSE